MINTEEEKDIEIPGEEDENVGSEVPPKKKEKRRKTKEEKIAERKVIFWTFLVILAISIFFWLMPQVKLILQGKWPEIKTEKEEIEKTTKPKGVNKNYVEIVL